MKLYDLDGIEILVKETTLRGVPVWGVFKVIRHDPKSDGRQLKLVSSIPPQTDRGRAEILARAYVERRGGRVEVSA
jgi:hypothetical protein